MQIRPSVNLGTDTFRHMPFATRFTFVPPVRATEEQKHPCERGLGGRYAENLFEVGSQ